MQATRIFPVLTVTEAKELVDRNNALCPFSKFIGNKHAVDIMADIAYSGLLSENRACPGIGIFLYGQKSTGKTTLGRLFIDLLDLPSLYVQANSILSIDHLMHMIEDELNNCYLYLDKISDVNGKDCYELPPMCVFLEEVHGLSLPVLTGLLTALDQKISKLIGSTSEFNCKNVYWIAATTERGKLPATLESRFLPVALSEYTVDEVANIVKMNTRFDDDSCLRIAILRKIPREALEFSKEIEFAATRMDLPIKNAVNLVAKRYGINDDGIDDKQIKVMVELAGEQDGKSLTALCNIVGASSYEMTNHILPSLLMNTSDRKAYVRVSNRHHITSYGIAYLKSRGII